MRSWLVLAALVATSAVIVPVHGQSSLYRVVQSPDGTIYTMGYYPSRRTAVRTYVGSPYLTYPSWQPAKVRLDQQGEEITCEVAYNVLDSQVSCRFDDTTKIKVIKPYAFTIDGVRFLSMTTKAPKLINRRYYCALLTGKASLWKEYKHAIALGPITVVNNQFVGGYFIDNSNYYVQRNNEKPKLIQLTRTSLLAALSDADDALQSSLKLETLTENDLIKAVGYYNGLRDK